MSTSEIVKTCGNIGSLRANTNVIKSIFLSFMAGAFIALGGLLMAIVVAGLPQSAGSFLKLIGGLLFPVGLVMVVLGGADLFTGNCLYYAAGVMQGKLSGKGLLKSSVISYLGNLFGALFIAYLAIASGLLSTDPWLTWINKLSVAKIQLSFMQAFWRGVGCNWLVCMALWMGLSSEQVAGKILGIWVGVAAFVTMGFEHSIANMFFIPAGIWSGAHVTWMQFWINNELPVTIGNIIGGSVFVGMIMVFCHSDIRLFNRGKEVIRSLNSERRARLAENMK